MPRALIVGAGIGGLAAALALRKAGWDASVFERSERPRELGFGLALGRNAIEALRELGVADAVLPATVVPDVADVRHIDGRRIRRFAFDVAPAAATALPRIVLRRTLHRALLSAVGDTAIVAGRQVVACTAERAGASIRCADGTHASADIVVGADGVDSVIRAQLHMGEPPPRPSGYFALRGASNAVDALGGLRAIMYYGQGIECGVAQASADRIYWFFSLLAEDVHRGSRDGQRAAPEQDAEALVRAWLPRFDDQFRCIAAGTSPPDLRLDELMVRPPLAHWGRDRVTLLGDAAHPVLPHTAQGAAQALEDAVGLGRALRNDGDQLAALRRYEAVRGARTARFVKAGPRVARIAMSRNPIVAGIRAGLIRHLPAALIARTLHSTYRDPNRALGGPLSEDAAIGDDPAR